MEEKRSATPGGSTEHTEGQAAKSAAQAPLLTSEEALQQAHAEGLVLRVGEGKTGYFGVILTKPGQPKPYTAVARKPRWQESRGGKKMCLGQFATPEAAVLSLTRFLRF